MEYVKSLNKLTLSHAIKTSQLQEFVTQEEELGIGPIGVDLINKAIASVVISHPPQGRTSGSPLRDGLSGKKTR